MRTWRRSALLAVLLGAALPSGRALADGQAPRSPATFAIAEPSASAPADAGGYGFPTPREQFRSWAMNAFGPAAIAGNLAGASWRQWVTDVPSEWDTNGRDFARRFGTGSLTTAIGETSLSLASAAMGQDPGYYRSPRPGLVPRVGHVLAMTVMARARDGHAVFSPGKAISPFIGSVVTVTTLYPDGNTFTDGLVSGAIDLLITAGRNGVREFVLKAPAWEGGRPAGR